jgi:hypothetical protein
MSEKLKPCPFCGCEMGVWATGSLGYRWMGVHGQLCPLASNPSATYGQLKDLVKEWNTRAEEDDAKNHNG